MPNETTNISKSNAYRVEIGDTGQPVIAVPINPITPKPVGATVTLFKNGLYDVSKFEKADVRVPITADSGNSEKSEGVKLNIEYGETAPTDKSKLWIKGKVAEKVTVSPDFEQANTIEDGIAKIPVSANAMGAGAVDNEVYLFGGNDWGAFLDTIVKFDIETKQSVILDEKLEAPCVSVACKAVNENIYIAGGATRNNGYIADIYKFNARTRKPTKLDEKLPVACADMGVGKIGSDIYYVGGVCQGANKYTTKALRTILRLDTKTDKLSVLPIELPEGVRVAGCATIEKEGLIYVVSDKGKIYVVDVINKTEIKELPVQLGFSISSCACVERGGKIYVIGGLIGVDSTDEIWVLDTKTQTLKLLETALPVAMQGFAYSIVENRLYMFGGANVTFGNGKYLDDVHAFIFDTVLKHNEVYIHTADNGEKVKILSDSEIEMSVGVSGVYRGDENNVAQPAEAYVYENDRWRLIVNGKK